MQPLTLLMPWRTYCGHLNFEPLLHCFSSWQSRGESIAMTYSGKCWWIQIIFSRQLYFSNECRIIQKDLIVISLKIIMLHYNCDLLSCGFCSGLLTRIGELILESYQVVQLLLA